MRTKTSLWLILMVLLVLALAACPQPVSPPLPPPEEPPELPPGLSGPVLAALYDGITVRLWDGTNAVDWKTGAAAPANGRRVAVNQVLYTLGENGAILESVNLPAPPVAVIKVNPVWTFENITNAEAFALDWTPPATGGNYTRVWRDGLEHGDWHANAFTHVQSYLAANGDIIIIDNITSGRFHDASRALDPGKIIWAVPEGPIFYLPDSAHPTDILVFDAAHPSGFTPTWSGLSSWPRVPWIKHEGVWYNGWGDKWDGSTFWARSTALSVFNAASPPPPAWQAAHGFIWPAASEGPIMIPAYIDAGMIYFIECTTGTLWGYSPATNVIGSCLGQLYAGDGKDATAAVKRKMLKPEWIEGAMYYHDETTLWKREGASGIISVFSADQQMWVMK